MTNKNYNTVKDFLNDVSFNNWALNEQLTDVSFWDFWLENNPDKKEIAQEAKDLIIGIKFKENTVSKEKVDLEWNKFASKINKTKVSTPTNKRSYKWIGIAASLLLFISFSIYFVNNETKITHKTSYGEILDLKLKDGNLVTLNANSSISYYKNNSRKVWLQGEAYFKIDKKESTNAKFWVITNDLEVEVYGTVFNVNSKKEKTQVYLEEGNIWLELKNGEEKRMMPGNFISFSAKENKILEIKDNVIAHEKTSWTNGTLIFKNTTLKEALNKVTETYGCEIIFKGNTSKQTLITGTVPTTNVDICIKAIEKSANVKIRKENTKLIVYKK